MATDIISKALTAMEIIVAAVLVSYYVGHNRGINEAGERVVERVDTLVVRDTITQYKPILEERRVIERVPFPVVDTLMMRDTLYVYLEREQVIWQDSLARVYASGISPQVDSVEHFVTEKIITRETIVPQIQKTRWGIGIQAGYGVYLDGQVRTAPYIGVGISYNLLRF
jgi:hypothetical protein